MALGLRLPGSIPDVPGKSRRLEGQNQEATRVELPPSMGVNCGSRKRVMVVVPGEPKRRQAQEGIVAALVFRLERPRSKPVTNRVDAPDEVVHQEYPNQAPPEEAEQQTFPRTRGERDSNSGKKQSRQRPEVVGAGGASDYIIAEEVGSAMAPVGRIKIPEEPSHVSVK